MPSSCYVHTYDPASRLKELTRGLLSPGDHLGLVDGPHDPVRHENLAIDNRRPHIAPPATVDELADECFRIKRSRVGTLQGDDREVRALPDLNRAELRVHVQRPCGSDRREIEDRLRGHRARIPASGLV